MSQETEQNLAVPDYFEQAVQSMSHAQVRSGISLGNIRPPRNLAPLSHAVGLEVLHPEFDDDANVPEFSTDNGGDAFGRLILLHDPHSDESWEGAKMRMVAYIQADMDASVASDPLLPDVAWDWLTEELNSPSSPYTNLGGTVTSTASVRYGEIGGPPRAFQIEMRASWTATGVDLSGHVQAFARVLANVAGLPPEGVTYIGMGKQTGSSAG
ncbi:DUF3000 domain-containing protein [Corynebacterium anserum]|uniref:DUF3000 family protein n=1 Tax=Corynebacterium anserum TaxID=2684406 RepID=A0A7G7YNM4_9CORY|nr:DUF3000 domain-containing protein [Corynebacterium anserum]MBC2681675.1 DUF3000 family protein [Corynebacterium anserum]QNH96094.1 DUF3000 family protein [Corynebacterium anserum]